MCIYFLDSNLNIKIISEVHVDNRQYKAKIEMNSLQMVGIPSGHDSPQCNTVIPQSTTVLVTAKSVIRLVQPNTQGVIIGGHVSYN